MNILKLNFFKNKKKYFVISYPKSGNTWMRFLLASYFINRKVELEELNQIIPTEDREIDVIDKDLLRSFNVPKKVFKSHQPFASSYKNVIYLVRDPRDVAVSYYFHNINVGNIDKETSFDDYIEKEFNNSVRFGSWRKHVDSWLNNKHKLNILFIRYEDLLSDTFGQLSKVLKFMNIDVDIEKAQNAINNCSIDELREIADKSKRKMFKEGKNSEFFRSGKQGEFKEYFTEEKLEKFNAIYKRQLEIFGYY